MIDAVLERVGGGGMQAAMGALARYGLADAARRSYDLLSGGQKARLEVLALELEGHNLLLLDEPTDNLDIESSEALENALDGLSGDGRRGLARPGVPAHDEPVPDAAARRHGPVIALV